MWKVVILGCVSPAMKGGQLSLLRVWGRKERTEGEENEMTVPVFRSQETLVSKRIFMSPDCAFSNCQTKDWWTYEFCYGRHIQQYHMEGESVYVSPRPSLSGVTGSLPPSLLPSRPQNDNVFYHMPSLTDSEVKGDVLYLGYYQSAFNWDDETAKVTGMRGRNGLSSGNRGGSDLAGVFPGVWCPSRPSALGPRSLCSPGSCGRLARPLRSLVFLTPSPFRPMFSPGLQAASAKALPQPDLRQRVQV